jgi:drug/metabolite transporter (DMT)-like permease
MQRAILIMLLAMSMIPAGDSAGKLLTGFHGVSPLFVAWSRFVLGALLVLPFLPAGAMSLIRIPAVWFRAAFLAGGITCIQTALQTADVATVFAAFFIGPLFSYVLAIFFLKERVTPLRSLLILLGFCGVLLVVRPGPQMEPGLLWALAAGLFYGAFLTMSRALTGIAMPLALVFSQLFIPALLMLPFGLLALPQPTAAVAGLTLASAAFSMFGNLLLLYAYRIASATQLAPLVYFQLIAAVLLGWFLFGNLPDGYTWAGLALIIGAGLASARLRVP